MVPISEVSERCLQSKNVRLQARCEKITAGKPPVKYDSTFFELLAGQKKRIKKAVIKALYKERQPADFAAY